ncbi:MAG: DUF6713 family protein [Chloroflexota bacterium]
MLTEIIFALGIALLFTHELDAIRHHEWRIFAFLRPFGDEGAYQLFVLLHIPLFLLFLWPLLAPARGLEIVIDAFLIIHVGLHYLFRTHPDYTFQGWLSHGVIVLAGFVGAWHLWLIF